MHSNKMSKNIPDFFKLYPPPNSNLSLSLLYYGKSLLEIDEL